MIFKGFVAVECYLFDLDHLGRPMTFRRGVMGRVLGREGREESEEQLPCYGNWKTVSEFANCLAKAVTFLTLSFQCLCVKILQSK